MHETAVLTNVDWAPSATAPSRFAELGVPYGLHGRQSKAPEGLNHCRQVHGTRVVEASQARTAATSTVRIEADAIYSRNPSESVAVKTADCLPVLLCDRAGSIVLAAHAGWRGLTAGVLGCSVGALAGEGVRSEDLHALVGPTICRERFQVGPEVLEAVLGADLGLSPGQAGLVMAKGRGDRWHVDLVVAAVFALVNAGLRPEHVTVVQECTHEQADRWYSYRREGKGAPSNWSWIRAR